MKRSFLTPLFAILTIGAAVAAEKKVVVISIDGLKGTTLATLASRKLNTPNLNEFIERGAVSEGLVGVFPTVTYPSHTTLVTGRSPAAHGIAGNTLFDPERKMNGAWYWYAEQIKVATLWDAARARGLKTAAVSWPVTVGAAIDFNFPEYRQQRTIDDRMLLTTLTTPGLFAEFEKAEGSLPLTGDNDHDRTRQAAYLIRTRKPDLILVHLIDLDHDEHQYGPDAPEALKTLETIDDCIGKIRQEVKRAGLEQDTVFIVTSDHGFWPVAKSFFPNAVLNSLGLSGSEKEPAKWRIGAHSNGAAFALVARDPSDLEAIEIATRTMKLLQAEGRWGFDRVYTRAELDAMKAFPGAFLAVSMQSGFTLGGANTGPWLAPSGNTRGMHGYAPGPRDLDAAFVAFGAGIAPRRLERGKLQDVAPTIAEILKLKLEGMEGQNLLR